MVGRSGARRIGFAGALLALAVCASGQTGSPDAQVAPVSGPQVSAAAKPAEQNAGVHGGTIRGTVVAGTAGKPGGIPLPGVAVTAKNTLTGKQYTTATDVDGAYSMSIPAKGRYVVRVELSGFAPATQEVVLSDIDTSGAAAAGITIVTKPADFGLQLASRVAAAEARASAAAHTASNAAVRRGVQSLSLNGGNNLDAEDASAAGLGNAGATQIGGVGEGAESADSSIVVTGQQGTTNALAGISEDEIRQRVEDGVAMARASGMLPQSGGDPTNAIVGVLSGIMNGGGFGGPGGPGGPGGGGGFRGRRGGGGGGGGRGNFRNFNPAQPHGSIFWQGGNNALNSAPWQPSLVPVVQPAGYQNRFGVSLAGTPYIPGLTKPDTRQFMFININGQKNLAAYSPTPVRVPTLLERQGDFSQSTQIINGVPQAVQIYDPRTGTLIASNKLSDASTPISPAALALLNFYPACNINCDSSDPTTYNYQTVSNAGNNNISINSRYTRTIGQQVNQRGRFGGFGGFGGGGFGGGGGGNGRRGQANQNAKPTLRQNINAGFNYAHNASDIRNIFLPLGGATASDGYGLTVGYTIGYGRLSNSASATWNRSSAQTRNYFTDTANNPAQTAGLNVPNQASNFADARFYNGLPSIGLTNFASLTNTSPKSSVNQTIGFSDFVSWRRGKHNMRFGFDVHRVHADSIGGSNPLGSFSFTGFATESQADKQANTDGETGQATTGSAFADFLFGLPTQTSIQAGLFKTYLRQTTWDGYAQDDFRVLSNLTLNVGLRYEYFAPYVEKNNRMVNLDHNADFTQVAVVQPNGSGSFNGAFPRSLVNPDRTMFAPRIGIAYRPRNKGWTKNTVIRGGYGINYNTTQYQTFASQLTFQPPFAVTQTNSLTTAKSNTGCTTTTTGSTANMTLTNGFNCSTKPIQNNYSVAKDYRLGMVQIYNLNIQRSVPLGIVLNVGYTGSKGSGLDIVANPNQDAVTVTTSTAQSFLFEDSLAASHMNQLVVSAQKRQQKGISLGATYTYSHAIDNASSIGGGLGSAVQNYRRLDLEYGNSNFDRRHQLIGNWVAELPFGPNRAFLNKGGVMSRVLDGWGLSGNFMFSSGAYFTPSYQNSVAQELAGGNYTLRPDRVFSQAINGAGTLKNFFNKSAFVKPSATNGLGGYGTASRNSIEGPGTVSVSSALSRTFSFGDTRALETRITATNVFNTVQYSGINTNLASANFGQVTGAAAMRSIQLLARYRF